MVQKSACRHIFLRDNVYYFRWKLPQDISVRLMARRAELGMTQEVLASKTDISRAHVSGIERGVHNTSVSAVYKIAEALDCLPSDLWLTAERLL